MKKCIDVSNWQGDIDWKKVKDAGYNNVMIRMGYGWGSNEDPNADRNIRECEKYGINYGLYYYSYATTMEEAKYEVNAFLKFVSNYKPTLPIVIDTEDADNWRRNHGLSSWKLTVDMIVYQMQEIERAGYYAMYYCSTSWYRAMHAENKQLSNYDLWLAHWWIDSPPVNCGIWQFRSDGTVLGIDGNVDLNVMYKDYSILIKNSGLNRIKKEPIKITKPETKTSSTPKKITEEWLADYIINNENHGWGNGTQRYIKVTKAGLNYDKLMDIINIKLGYKKAPIKIGDTISITGSKYATGEYIPDWVKAQKHIVSEINDGQALLGYPNGICSWVYLKDVRK